MLPRFRAGSRHLSSHRGRLADFFAEKQSISSAKTTGLFGNDALNSARGLEAFSKSSLATAQKMDQTIQQSKYPSRKTILELDILSDVICKVVDMAAFVRLSHPSRRMLDAAQQAHETMFEFMNHLNTSPELYAKVRTVLETPEISTTLTTEEFKVAEILKHDFEKSGIQFDDRTRESFVQSANTVSILGQQFLNNIGPEQHQITFSADELVGLDPYIIRRLRTFTGKVQLPLDSQLAEVALQTVHDPQVRKRIWNAVRTPSEDQIQLLTEVLRARSFIAKMCGYDSFASYELTDKLMKTPDHVKDFLDSLAKTISPLAKQELATITPTGVQLNPWDHSYYLTRHTASKRGSSKDSAGALAGYFSLGNVMQGISDVCERLYGLRFVPGTVMAGEVWDSEVRRLDVFEGDSRVGVIYCDLFTREGKAPHPAHFTIQCSRQVYPEEELFNDPSLNIRHSGPGGQIEKFQIPIIALVCDFHTHNGTTLLSFSEVQTLFHEMGHAIHSMIGRTRLHNVSGTRCATDFVELPSVLMEKFASAPQVLQLYARHHKTGEPLPMELFKTHQNLSMTSENWETHHQIVLSFIDQALHSSAAGSQTFNPTAIVDQVLKQRSLYNTNNPKQYGQFGHLVSYGATYYSYLLDRCLANMTWNKLFKEDPLSRESGEKLKTSVLQWGGSRDALVCAEELLGEIDYSQLAQHLR